MKYPIHVNREGDAFVISSRDLAELNAVAYSEDEILKETLDAIETTFMIYMGQRKAIPVPSKKLKDEILVNLPIRVSTKVALYNEMLKQEVTKAELARRLEWNQVQVDRLWSLDHSTKLEAIEAAFHAIGKELDVIVA